MWEQIARLSKSSAGGRPSGAGGTLGVMAAVAFQLRDRVYGLDGNQAVFLAAQMRRKLTVPEPIAELADSIWEQSMLNPDSEPSQNIELTPEQKRETVELLRRFTPEGDREAWDALASALENELAEDVA
jgi:hypothetical protein